MLFYASLFLLCVAVSAIILWLYRSMYSVARATYQAIFPSTREEFTDEREVSLRSTLQATPTPWGWSSDYTPRTVAPAIPRVQPSEKAIPVPWGWKGNTRNTELTTRQFRGDVGEAAAALKNMVNGLSSDDDDNFIGWPYRDEHFDFAGKEYNVTRKTRVEKTNLGVIPKPWGW